MKSSNLLFISVAYLFLIFQIVAINPALSLKSVQAISIKFTVFSLIALWSSSSSSKYTSQVLGSILRSKFFPLIIISFAIFSYIPSMVFKLGSQAHHAWRWNSLIGGVNLMPNLLPLSLFLLNIFAVSYHANLRSLDSPLIYTRSYNKCMYMGVIVSFALIILSSSRLALIPFMLLLITIIIQPNGCMKMITLVKRMSRIVMNKRLRKDFIIARIRKSSLFKINLKNLLISLVTILIIFALFNFFVNDWRFQRGFILIFNCLVTSEQVPEYCSALKARLGALYYVLNLYHPYFQVSFPSNLVDIPRYVDSQYALIKLLAGSLGFTVFYALITGQFIKLIKDGYWITSIVLLFYFITSFFRQPLTGSYTFFFMILVFLSERYIYLRSKIKYFQVKN